MHSHSAGVGAVVRVTAISISLSQTVAVHVVRCVLKWRGLNRFPRSAAALIAATLPHCVGVDSYVHTPASAGRATTEEVCEDSAEWIGVQKPRPRCSDSSVWTMRPSPTHARTCHYH